ncbi:MAG TPA: putative zinc-binding metallopeptidase [Polyangiaceae bacterium]|nr:putative zinc-binding metallopeptidase [Polyangiaceae bacterium]
MRLFSCPQCDRVLFFENTVCTHCGQHVGYSVEARALVAVPTDAEKARKPFTAPAPGARSTRYLKCKNFSELDSCNWLVCTADESPYCRSCRLTEMIPDLGDPKNRAALLEIERAKRRLIYTLLALKLPVVSKQDDPEGGLRFDFLRGTEDKPVMTGHDEGLITLNVAEAEAAFRENMREKMGEGYRTLLGHLRHEIGHYYWNRLIRDTPALAECRALFGDDEQSYEAAIERHYGEGPPANWSERFVSAYATMHPWEDWAETWAHYLHMVDTLETAKNHGLSLRVPGSRQRANATVATDALAFRDYDSLSRAWHAVTLALNDLNRSMGVKDAYPFVLSPAVHDKLRFIHDVIRRSAARSSGSWLGWLRFRRAS